MFKNLLIAMNLFLITSFETSHSSPKEKSYGVGMAAGMVGGLGFSLEKWVNEKNGIQLNFAPLYIERIYPEDNRNNLYNTIDSGYSNYGFISLGFNYLHQLGRFRKFEILSFVGGNFMGTYDEKNYYESWNKRHIQGYDERNIGSLGGGVGGQLNIWRLEGTALVGFVGAYDFISELKRLTPSIDISVHFML